MQSQHTAKSSEIFPSFHLKKFREINCNWYAYAYNNVEKCEIICHWSFLSWNQLFSKFFSKIVAFMKIFSNMSESKFP